MTLFDNSDFLNILASIGAQDVLKNKNFKSTKPNIIKSAQQATNAALAKYYLENLKSKISPQAATQSSVDSRGSESTAELKGANVDDFRTLGDFIRYAEEQKLTWSGKRFSWLATDTSLPQDKAGLWIIDAMSKDRVRAKQSREVERTDYYVSKDGLIGYLTSLRDNEATKNRVLQVMIKKNIEEVNGILRGTGAAPLSTRPASSMAGGLDLEAAVDGLGSSNILDVDDWQAGLNAHPNFETSEDQFLLKVKDLLNSGAFLNWLKKFKVRTMSKDSQGYPVEEVVDAVGTNGDPCTAVHILYKRASFLKNYASADEAEKPNYGKMVDLYLKVVQEYGRQLVGKDGKKCNVISLEPVGPKPTPGATGPGGRIPTSGLNLELPGGPVGPGGRRTPGKGGRGGDVDEQVDISSLSQVVYMMPLDLSLIGERKISSFLLKIAEIMPEEANAAGSIINPLFSEIKVAFKDGQADLPLNQKAIDIEGSMHNYVRDYCATIARYKRIIAAVEKLIIQFKDRFESDLKDEPKLWSKVTSQAGNQVGDSYSIARQIISILVRLQYSGNSKCAPGLS